MNELTPERIAERQCELALEMEKHSHANATACYLEPCSFCGPRQELLDALNCIVGLRKETKYYTEQGCQAVERAAALQQELQLAKDRAEKAEAQADVLEIAELERFKEFVDARNEVAHLKSEALRWEKPAANIESTAKALRTIRELAIRDVAEPVACLMGIYEISDDALIHLAAEQGASLPAIGVHLRPINADPLVVEPPVVTGANKPSADIPDTEEVAKPKDALADPTEGSQIGERDK